MKEEKQLKKWLMNRAWLIHSLKLTLMILSSSLGKEYWKQEGNIDPECSPRKKLYASNDDYSQTLQQITILLLVINALLDLVCW